MGRKKKEKTTLARVKLADLKRMREIAKSMNLSLPDYISLISKRKKK